MYGYQSEFSLFLPRFSVCMAGISIGKPSFSVVIPHLLNDSFFNTYQFSNLLRRVCRVLFLFSEWILQVEFSIASVRLVLPPFFRFFSYIKFFSIATSMPSWPYLSSFLYFAFFFLGFIVVTHSDRDNMKWKNNVLRFLLSSLILFVEINNTSSVWKFCQVHTSSLFLLLLEILNRLWKTKCVLPYFA